MPPFYVSPGLRRFKGHGPFVCIESNLTSAVLRRIWANAVPRHRAPLAFAEGAFQQGIQRLQGRNNVAASGTLSRPRRGPPEAHNHSRMTRACREGSNQGQDGRRVASPPRLHFNILSLTNV